MRLSRPCYDKPHRCPGWAGGGMKYAKVDRCDNGRVLVGDPAFWITPGAKPLRFGRCATCGVITLPFALRRLDPTWWPSHISMWRLRRRNDRYWRKRR